jgi:hypothetical protein
VEQPPRHTQMRPPPSVRAPPCLDTSPDSVVSRDRQKRRYRIRAMALGTMIVGALVSAAHRREQFRAPDGDAGVGRATRCEVGGSAADGVGSCWRWHLTQRAAGGRPRARGAVRSTVPRSTVPRQREDSPLPGSTSTSTTAAVNDSTRSSRATEPRPQSPRWDSRPFAGHESVSRSGMNPAPSVCRPRHFPRERPPSGQRSPIAQRPCRTGAWAARSASSESPPRAGRSGRTRASGSRSSSRIHSAWSRLATK